MYNRSTLKNNEGGENMARQSKDPYGDFVVRIINSCRIAANQAFGMSDDEYFRVMKVHELMTTLDPDAQRVRKASVPIVIPTHVRYATKGGDHNGESQ